MFDKCQTFRYYGDMQSKTIKTRELLRNFKNLKEELTSGRIHYVVIDIGGNRELELTMKAPKNTAENILRFLETQPKPRKLIRRTRIFDTLLTRKS
jgi:hypothetical protein